MSHPLSPEQVAQLLPALDPLAETLARRGQLDEADLRIIRLGLGLDAEWAGQELERWANILASAHDPDRALLAQRALTLRGVPAEDAARAVDRVAQVPPVAPPPPTAPAAPATPDRRPWLWAGLALWLVVMSLLGWWVWRQTQPPPPPVVLAPPTILPSATRPAPTVTLTPQVQAAQPTVRPSDTTLPSTTSPTRPPATATAAPVNTTPPPAATATRAATPTPIPPTRTRAPRATLRPSAAACAPPAGPAFVDVWANLGLDERTGCPTAAEKALTTSYQPFERGFMLWRQDTRQIYAVYDDGLWQVFDDTWQEGDPEYSCRDTSTPSRTPPTPRRGIGKAWCTQPGVRDKLGNALQDENGNLRPVQDFQQATLVSIIERDVPVYALLRPTQRWVSGSPD